MPTKAKSIEHIWPNHVRTAYELFKEKDKELSELLEEDDYESIEERLVYLEILEHRTWLAWGECTRDINPTLLADVQREYPKCLTPSTKRYLEKYLYFKEAGYPAFYYGIQI